MHNLEIGKAIEEFEIDELQSLQNEFCKVVGVCAFCVDSKGIQKTDFSGKESEIQRIHDAITEEEIKVLLNRVQDGSIEDQVVEKIPGIFDMEVAALAIRIEKKAVLYWVVFSCGLEENHFYDSLDLLREYSTVLVKNEIKCIWAEKESEKSHSSEMEMGVNLKDKETMAEIVQLLDSNKTIEEIMDKFLGITGGQIQVDCAYIFQEYEDINKMDVLVSWCREGAVSVFDRTKGIELSKQFSKNKLVVISSNTVLQPQISKALREKEITALLVFPIMAKGNQKLYAGFMQKEKNRIWNIEEVKFVSDAVKVLQSILTRRIQKNSIASSFASLSAILDNVGCAVYVKDMESDKVLFENSLLKNLFKKELVEKSFDKLIRSDYIIAHKKGNFEIYVEEKNQWYELLFTNINWVDGRKAFLCSLYDITDRKIYQRKIEQQANTDFLTGLYNRMCCEKNLAIQIDEAKRTGKKGCLMYLDLDDFKHINDGLGHQYGDVLLKAISHSLQRIKGIEHNCYRMGGDEFVIVVSPEYYKSDNRIVDEIREIFNKPWFLKDADYYCTMSMGIVTFPDHSESVQELIKMADIAMYEAKKSGKNRVAQYTDNLSSTSGRRLDMEKNMREATVRGYQEFEVYFQPIVDIQKEGTPCTGAEALIRWNSAELGFISPAEFIPLAEYLGLINPIGNYVLLEACKNCKAWNDNGHPEYKVNVNLSVVQLLQADIVDIVERIVKETGINPRNLTLEVTESLAINDIERMIVILGNIKKLGVRIALDDFGTGYSSLNHIRKIPFDVIKMDQSFVKDLTEEAYTQSVIKMVAELAQTIGVSICVEGIETKDQYKLIEHMKVQLVQGYFFDRPMPRSEFEKKYVYAT